MWPAAYGKSEVKKIYYPALVDKDEDSDFGVSFPDFPGCVSAGESIEDALLGAQEALAGHAALMLADGDLMPAPSPLGEVAGAKEPSTVAVTLIPLVLPGRARRVNVTLDETLLEEIDQISNNRSGFLAEAARAELARRRA
jgi:predicted RNase H-like HicB family nuclease